MILIPTAGRRIQSESLRSTCWSGGYEQMRRTHVPLSNPLRTCKDRAKVSKTTGGMTVPELARHLGISDQTVRRWVRTKRVPSKLNAQGWPTVRPEDVPADLIEATKKLSGARYPKSDPESSVELRGEIAYLRGALEKALGIIALLSSPEGDGDHTLSNGTEGA